MCAKDDSAVTDSSAADTARPFYLRDLVLAAPKTGD